MSSYYLKCRKKNTKIKKLKVVKTRNRRITLLSKSAVRTSTKSKFTKERETRALLSTWWIRTPLSQIPLLGSLLLLKVQNKWNNKQIFISRR